MACRSASHWPQKPRWSDSAVVPPSFVWHTPLDSHRSRVVHLYPKKMSRLFQLVLVFVAKALTAAAQQWTLQASTTATTLVGVGAGSDTAIAAAAMDGTGAVAEVYSSGKWANSKVAGGLLLDAAISNDGTLSVVTSILPVFVQDTTASNNYVQAVGVGGAIMSASIFGSSNAIGLVGSIVVGKKSVNGVAVSTDRGKTFSASPVPSGYTRYASFVDSQTFVVSAGIWGEDANSTSVHHISNHHQQDISLSARLRTGKGGKRQPVGGDEPPVNDNGWLASISMSTDGGSTFQEVFRSPQGSQYYFNGVSCSGSTCVAVAEGDTASGGTMGMAFASSDNGKTWTQTFYSDELFSLMAVAMTSPTTGWMAGAVHARGMTGQFYYTADAGQTWVLKQTMDNCMPLDLSFTQSGDLGVTSCVSSSGSTAQAALYM